MKENVKKGVPVMNFEKDFCCECWEGIAPIYMIICG